MKREQNRNGGKSPRGRTVPRESDEQLLSEYADRMENGEVGAASLGGA